jgi:Patatin-like phospholipase
MAIRLVGLNAMSKKSIYRRFVIAAWVPAIFVLVACGAPLRDTIAPDEMRSKRQTFIQRKGTAYRTALETALRRLELISSRASNPHEATFDILMIHGGGPAGGFAAGVLDGWGQVNTPDFARPEFDHVTGSSSGSLVAPFAFIGTPEAYRRGLHNALNPPTDWGSINPVSFWPFRKAMLNNSGLKNFIQNEFNAEIISQIAQAGDQHKMLLITATNMDLGLGRAWDLAIEAKKATSSGEFSKIYNILLASTALPIVLPPIEIDGELYSDGGIAMTLFLGFDLKGLNWMAETWRERHPGIPLPTIRLWAIINQKLIETGKTVQPQYIRVGSRSLEIMMKYDRFKALLFLEHMIARVDDIKGIRAEFRFIAIPENGMIPSDLTELKNKKLVSELVDLGRRLGANSSSWESGLPDPYALPTAPTD